jgi:predicted kinase
MVAVSRAPSREGTSRPMAIVVCGAPGSGKSTVGALAARRMRAALLDLDTATASLTAVISSLHGSDDLDDPTLVSLTREARYETLARLAEDNLTAGIDVVLVAPYTSERRDLEAWEALQRRMDSVGADATMFWLRISATEVLRRVERRAAGRDREKLVGEWPAGLDLGPPAVPHVEVDALLSPSDIAATIVSSLTGGPRS